jgi:hypothetical protein
MLSRTFKTAFSALVKDGKLLALLAPYDDLVRTGRAVELNETLLAEQVHAASAAFHCHNITLSFLTTSF